MSRGKQILELMARLEGHPGTEAFRRLDSLGWSVFTFDSNTRDLLSLLDYLTQNPASWELQALRRRDQLERAQREVGRRLHNMVAAAFSLIEHTRVLRRHMHDPSEGTLYRDPATDEPIQKRIEQEFAADPDTKFLQDLRRFTQHRELPTLISEVSQKSPEDPIVRRILLSAAQLLTWTGWSQPSKQFLERAGDKIDLRELLIRYEARVRRFYYDFETHYRDLYQEALDERRSIEWDLIILQLTDSVSFHTASLPDGTVVAREEAFASALSSSEMAEVEAAPDGPLRADVVLTILARHGEVPEQTRDAIRKFYDSPSVERRESQKGVPAIHTPPNRFERDEKTGLLIPSSQQTAGLEAPELGPPQTIRDSKVPLIDLIDDSRGDYIDRVTAERCEIVGPAIVVPMETEFQGCTWDSFGPNPRDLFWELTGGQKAIIGAIALRECHFVQCSFSRIGVGGTPEYLEGWQVSHT